MTHTDKSALRTLLTVRRALIDPAGHGFHRSSRRGRRAPGLSQHQVDQLLHRTPGTYRRLESGAWPRPDTGFLRDVAMLFALDEQEWVSLCRYAGIGDPPGPLTPRSGKEVPGVWQEAVDGMTHPAYITDASWELVTYNDEFSRLFPGRRVPTNTLRWMLLEPQGRAMLIDWENSWAPLVVPQLRAALATRPDDEVLRRIERTCRPTRSARRSGSRAAGASTPTATHGPFGMPSTVRGGSRCARRSPWPRRVRA